MSKEPDRLYIEQGAKKAYYDKLHDKRSPLARDKGYENKDLFILSMCIGYDEGIKIELNKKLGYFHSRHLSKKDEAIIYSIAAEEGGLEALIDLKNVYTVAEQYAKGGINILYDSVFSEFGSFSKRFESQLLKRVQNLEIS